MPISNAPKAPETKVPQTKAVEAKVAAPAVKAKTPAAKKAAPAKKTAAKKAAPVKKPAVKKVASPKAPSKVTVVVECYGKQVTEAELVKTAQKLWVGTGHDGAKIKSVELYIKPEDNAVYCAVNGEAVGKYDL